MTYDDRKVLRGQELVEEIDIYFDGCQFAAGEYDGLKSSIATTFPYSDTFIGTVSLTSFTAGWSALWAAVPGEKYIIAGSGEIVRVSITSGADATIGIVERAMFGTAAENLSGSFKIIHDGRANGSCRGYSQTCSNSGSYNPATPRILKFCSAPRVAGSIILPGLYHKAIDYDSAEVDVGESIGSPAKLKFTLQDFAGGDDIAVPYIESRSNAGTFWGRTLARNPYANGRKVVYRSGLRDAGTFGAPDFVERHFIIDTVSLSGGNATFSCLDPIILTEDKKAKMPVVSPAQLSANITGSPATFSYVNAPDYYFGAMSASIWVRIDSEVIRCTVSGPTQLTVTTRGYKSEAKDHEAGATVQDCVRFAGTHVIDAIVFALENYTSMPSSYIGDYTAVKALIPTVDLDEAIINKPQSVAEFISSMVKLGNLIFYFDEALLKIVIDYIPELSIQPINITEIEDILRGSVTVNENTKEQYTRFAHLWAPVDITKDTEENYAISYLAANLDVESPAKLGEINEKKTFKNQLLTNSSGDSLIGTTYASRIVSGADKSPKIVTARINAGSIGPNQGGNLKLGSIVNLVTKENQNIDGIPNAELFQVLKISGNAYENFNVKMRRYLAVQPTNVDFVITAGAVNYVLSDHFAPSSAGQYVVYVEQGAEFGSFNTAIAAFSTGTQASGVSLKIIMRGTVLGMGGKGGNAGVNPSAPIFGEKGGLAFECLCDCEIDCGSGLIWAGGAGGNGETYVYPQGPNSLKIPRKGGGGGQGYGTSLGGYNTDGAGGYTLRAESGSRASPGFNGGEWGEEGGRTSETPPAIGGIAIKSNGNSVTITAGNNDFNIRGRRT